MHNFFLYVYFYSLHVSGSYVTIIRKINLSMWHMLYVTLCRWTSGMQVGVKQLILLIMGTWLPETC